MNRSLIIWNLEPVTRVVTFQLLNWIKRLDTDGHCDTKINGRNLELDIGLKVRSVNRLPLKKNRGKGYLILQLTGATKKKKPKASTQIPDS